MPQRVADLTTVVAGGPTGWCGPALLCPLGSRPALDAVLVTSRVPGSAAFADHDLKLLAMFAAQAGLALQRAEHQRAYQELAVLADRDRIARDLHDHVIQRLYAVGLALQGTRRGLRAAEVAGRITDHIGELSDVIKDIRTAIFELEGDPSAASPARAALSATIAAMTADAAPTPSVTISGPVEVLPADLLAHAHAVVREATANAVRHAHASELTITITVGEDLVIDVTDDGVGIPAVPARRSGTRNLHRRAEEVGGTFTIGPVDGHGTRMIWTAPVHPKP